MAFTGTGFDGTVGEVEFAEILDAVGQHGVVGTYNGTDLSAAKVVGARQMLVQPGVVYAPGVVSELDIATLSPASSALVGSNPRIDLIVARFDWSNNTVSLQTKEGTPHASNPLPPGLTQVPGATFEVPIRQAKVLPGDGEYDAANMSDRRYWINGGQIVCPSNRIFPPHSAGLLVFSPDTGILSVSNGSSWQVYRPHSDTGWVNITDSSMGVYADGGSFNNDLTQQTVFGRKVNGWIILDLKSRKQGRNVTNLTIDGWSLPIGWRPDIDIITDLQVTNPPGRARWYIDNSGACQIDGLTANVTASIAGTVTFPAS